MAHLLVVDDEESICWGLAKLGQELGYSVSQAASAEEGLTKAAAATPDAIVLDVRLPGLDGLSAMERFAAVAPHAPIIVITAFGSLDTAVTAVRKGAFDYLTKPFELEQAATVLRRAMAHVTAPPAAAETPVLPSLPDELLGSSPAMQQVFKRIALAAPSDVSVLITGESGTGKELVARAIHRHSLRSSAPLLSVNLASLSPTLVESELFGHVRGAFTGADAARRGLLELANDATVFFDEIGDISTTVQVKLLRVLEQHEVTPVGDTAPRRTSFRVIAATNRNLPQAVQQGAFREDLFFRLAGFEINMPPLRERGDDLPLLAEHFLKLARDAGATATGFALSAMEELRQRPWPGNVRELRHAVEHAALLARGGPIVAEHLPPPRELGRSVAHDPTTAMQAAVRVWTLAQLANDEPPKNLYDCFLAAVEKPLFDVVLEKTDHNRTATADLLGIHRATLRKKLDTPAG
jgi:two-component system nitrogen regulation response regulator GlnG